jgi:probable F420-dependent oxidoreductase
VQFVFQYPEMSGTDGDMLDAGPVADVARCAEDVGFGGFAFTEHPAPGVKWLTRGGHQTLDPFVALGHVAAVTTTVRLLTYLSVVPYRNPLMLAKAAATVDILSDGRFVLGVGTGYLKGEFHAVGSAYDERNRRFDEALDVLPLAWSGEQFSYVGKDFEARDVVVRPKPRSEIPIWIGGNSALTRRRVAERAQGWMPLTATPEVLQTTRSTLIDIPDGLGRAITEVRQAAADLGRRIDVVVAYSHPEMADGGADLAPHRARLEELAAIGVDWVVVPGFGTTRDDTLGFLERFAATCITG